MEEEEEEEEVRPSRAAKQGACHLRAAFARRSVPLPLPACFAELTARLCSQLEGDESDDESGSEGDEEEEEEEPAPKKAKPSKPPKDKKKDKGGESDSDVEILEGLSGDEVDAHLIIPGGRGTRRGRGGPPPPTFAFKKPQKAGSDSDDL